MAFPTQSPTASQPQEAGLADLEAALGRDLRRLNYPPADWIPRPDPPARSDVVIIGAGLCGLVAAFALFRQGIGRVRILDRAEPGLEGPWVTYARMETLRSPKHLTGPAMGLPNLTFRAWFEAQWGEAAWETLGRIPREQWMAYLVWYRRVLQLPVENQTEVQQIQPTEDGFTLAIESASGASVIATRRVILATGREGIAVPRVPPPFANVLGERCTHSSHPIDFGAVKGQRVAVVGFAASAFDNAAMALEAGAKKVHMLARSTTVPRINKAKQIVYSGFTQGFPEMSDAVRFRLFNYIFDFGIAPPRDSVRRVSRHSGFQYHVDTEIKTVTEHGDEFELQFCNGALRVDHIILGTGFRIDVSAAPELAGFSHQIARWRDRFEPPPQHAHSEFLDFPYLGRGFQLMERIAGDAPFLSRLYCFSFAAALSLGNISSDIPAVSEGAERLARQIVRDFFAEDLAHHWQALQDFADPELLGDELEDAPWHPRL